MERQTLTDRNRQERTGTNRDRQGQTGNKSKKGNKSKNGTSISRTPQYKGIAEKKMFLLLPWIDFIGDSLLPSVPSV